MGQEESKIAMAKIVEENETLKQNLLNEQEKNKALVEELDEIEEEGDVEINDYTRENDELNNEVEVIDGQLDNAYKEIEKLKLELEVLKISSSSFPNDETTDPDLKKQTSYVSSLEDDLKMSNLLVESLKEELRKEQVKIKFLRLMPKNWGFYRNNADNVARNDNVDGNNSTDLQLLLKEAEEEITSLRKELEIAKECNEETETRNTDLEAKTRNKNDKNDLFYSCVEKGDSELVAIEEELFDAKLEIESLKRELSNAPKISSFESRKSFFGSKSSLSDSYDFACLPPDLSGAITQEVQPYGERDAEGERLERELEKTKKQLQMASTRDYKRSMSINSRYEELVRLSGACLDKDSEITLLRKELENSRKELENSRMHSGKSSTAKDSQGKVENANIENESSKQEDEGFWGFWGKKESQRNIGTDTKQNDLRPSNEERTNALEDMNDMLRKELASACQGLNETKRKLAEMELS